MDFIYDFIWITLVYVIVAFTDITASSFVGTVTLESGQKVGGSAIASSSIMYLILPIIMGQLFELAAVIENTETIQVNGRMIDVDVTVYMSARKM